MEEYRNEVINLQAINPRISVNFLVKLTGTNPKVRGGAIGGCPSASLSRPYLAPGGGVPRGHGASTMPVVQPTCQGHHPRSLAGEPWAPWHPFGGGYSRERLAGGRGGWSTLVFPCSASSPVVILPGTSQSLVRISSQSCTDFADSH